MKKHEIDSLQRDLDLDKESLKQTKECIANAKWYQPLYKRAMRTWIKELERRIKSQTETLKKEVNKHYQL